MKNDTKSNEYFRAEEMAGQDEFASIMPQVAEMLLGKPNRAMSSKTELRYGSNGAIAVDVKTGQAYDFASETGGGVLWLIGLCTGKSKGHAYQWLVDHKLAEDKPREASRTDTRRAPPTRPTAARVPPGPRDDDAGVPDAFEPAPEMPWEPAPDVQPATERAADAHSGRARQGRWSFLNLPDDAELSATYDYVDENGELCFQVCRFTYAHPKKPGQTEKSFRQRRPDPSRRDGWAWDVKDKVKLVPYRLPEVLEAIAQGRTVYVLEGEKDVDNAWAQGIPATCNAGGAGKWPEELSGYFAGADVVSIPDNDPQKRRKNPDGTDGEPIFHDDGKPALAGQDHARLVCDMLLPVAARVRVLELARHCPTLPPKGDLSDWFDQGGSADLLYGLTPAAVDGRIYDPSEWFLQTNYTPHFKWESLREIGQEGVKHEWIVKNVLSKNEMSMLAGASQAGKTFLVLDLCMAICRGTSFFGRRVVAPGAVFYQSGEGYAGVRSLRIPAYLKANGLTFDDDIPFELIGSPVDLWASDDDTDRLIADIQWKMRSLKVPLRLVVIDTLAAAMAGANENASEDVGRTLKRCDRIRRATGAAVLLVHHMNASGEKYRGWTGMGANVETVLIARELPDIQDQQGRRVRELEINKQKDGTKPQPIRYVLKSIPIGIDEDNEPVTSCIIDLPDAGFDEPVPPRPSPKGIKLSPQAKIMLECIERCVIRHPVLPPEGNDFRPGMGGTLDKYIRHLFKSKMGSGGKEDPKAVLARIRKAWERQIETLQAHGLIEVQDDYVWRTKKGLTGSLFDPDRDAGPDLVPTVAGYGDDFDVGF